MAIGVSGFFDNDNQEVFDHDYEGGIGICGSDTRERLKEREEAYDKDASIMGVHLTDD